ncbi:auxin-responsive protein SAUR23-like [Rhodamnia argentea]|uniref:Auxin-responsive protein SAUR23-like n=1 Tax=Rhodamnia argentea TaxID=178133 RepID=A0A8B8N8V0_9MYRT|nr:auxin-responsive protein SAUR23-like [Rhodamnia argentea]
MGIRLPSIIFHAKQALKSQPLGTRNAQPDVPRGHVAVYVGEVQRKRFLIPVSFLNHPSFRELLRRAEEEYGFEHPMGGLTIPCKEDAFIDLTTQLHGL